jgi:hypothetical protein
LKPLGEGSELEISENFVDHKSTHVRFVVVIAVPECANMALVSDHNCLHNQVAALRNRVLADVPTPDAEAVRMLTRVSNIMARHVLRDRDDVVFSQLTPEELEPYFPNHKKRERYVGGYVSWLEDDAKVDPTIELFIKDEKKTKTGDPRAIQFRRDPVYCGVLASYLKSIEHVIYNLELPQFGCNGRVVAKGLNQVQRARVLIEKYDQFRTPVMVIFDCKRFDMHVSQDHLRAEHRFYNKLFGFDKMLVKLLKMQLCNRGVSQLGVRYKVDGRRMSGDMNTALGNVLVMIMIVVSIFHEILHVKFDMLDDGDDCLLIFENVDWQRIKSDVVDLFLKFGMEIKIEAVATELEEADFCQSRPINLGKLGWKFVRNWQKVVSFGLSGISKSFKNPLARPALVNTIGMGELILNYGVPILQEYALALMRNAGSDKIIEDDESGLIIRVKRELKLFNLRKLERIDPAPISDTARESFELAFGVSISEQFEIERQLRNWKFSCVKLGQDAVGLDEFETYSLYSTMFQQEHNFM